MKRIALIATLVLVSATPAFAHAGHGIASGFLHPFLGWDHLIAMLTVGAWGATLGGRAIWAVPAAFVSAMIVGGAFGMAGIEVPFVETMILASVLVLAGLAIARVKLPVWSGMPLSACSPWPTVTPTALKFLKAQTPGSSARASLPPPRSFMPLAL